MTTVVVTCTAPAGGLIQAQIDGKPVSGEVKLDKGNHPLTWHVFGAPGTRYSIEISEPENLKFKHEATLDNEQKDAGLHWIVI